MGYNTRFELTLEPTKLLPTATPVGKYIAEFLGLVPEAFDEEAIVKRLEEISDYGFEDNVSAWYLDGKWYDHEEHMIQLSKEFPYVLFTLKGEGEESGDIWRAKVQNGDYKVQKARIVFDD